MDIPPLPIPAATRVIAEWLKERPYIAIIDEEEQIIGIITLQDLLTHPESLQVIDCNITKPEACAEQTIVDTFNLMKEAKTDFLPVYEGDQFVGVVALVSVMERLVFGLTGIY